MEPSGAVQHRWESRTGRVSGRERVNITTSIYIRMRRRWRAVPGLNSQLSSPFKQDETTLLQRHHHGHSADSLIEATQCLADDCAAGGCLVRYLHRIACM